MEAALEASAQTDSHLNPDTDIDEALEASAFSLLPNMLSTFTEAALEVSASRFPLSDFTLTDAELLKSNSKDGQATLLKETDPALDPSMSML